MNHPRTLCWIVLAAVLLASGCGDDDDTEHDGGAPQGARDGGGAAGSIDGAMDARVDGAQPEPGGKGGSAAPPVSGSDAREAMCEEARRVFLEFLDAHQACAVDEDCMIIGDCGPHADFVAVQAKVAAEARELQLATCGEAYDGPGFVAVCRAGKCDEQEVRASCCGCGDFDAGL